jgi:hypothetical protein
MRIDVSAATLMAGFFNEPMGTHTSRTIMLREVRALLGACQSGSSIDDYRHAAVEENVILKSTLSTRMKTFRHLRELYALSEECALFEAMRLLWWADTDGQPLLALSCACARDPLLRATADLVIKRAVGEEVHSDELAMAVDEAFPGRYQPGVLARIGRNIASSWQQAGHLVGKLTKTRSAPAGSPAATAYALFLSDLCGAKGDGLFKTLWTRMLDISEHTARAQAEAAARMGWLEYRHAGGVTDISFRYLTGQFRVSR